MLAGLIFAVQDADDRAGTLAATLPFAGMTLIEYQARLLIGAGVSQIVIVVARLTPELLGAVARIGRRGVTVDTVRGAGEAAARLHPLSHLLVLADGLVTTDAVLAPFARDGGDALLVLDGEDAVHGYERIGGGDVWAGVARLDGRRLAELDAERAALLDQLRAAAGLAGRDRRLGDQAERARKAVTGRIRDTLRRIDERHPALAAHLRESVTTGGACRYRPAEPVPWRL